MSCCSKKPTQNPVAHAPFDLSGGSSCVSNHSGSAGEKRAPEAPLGIYTDTVDRSARKNCQKTHAEKGKLAARREARHRLHREQRAAAKLIRKHIRQDHRVTKCKWIKAADRVQLVVNTYGEEGQKVRRASYKGLVICGNVWACPVCGSRISRVRRNEMNTLLAWAREQGLVPVLLTLTARHGRLDGLSELLHGMKEAKRRFRQRKEWRRLPFVGSVTATEITHGVKNGWHPHFHEIVLLRAESEAEALRMIAPLADVWRTCLRSYGLDGAAAAFDARGAAQAGNYVAKWGVAEEMTLTNSKRGSNNQKGRLPAELATLATNGDAWAETLWVEYFQATSARRRNQLVWSQGLKLRCGVIEVSDEEAAVKEADDEDDTEMAGDWDGPEWRQVRPKRVTLMEAAEDGGAEAVKAAASGPDDPDGETELIEDPLDKSKSEEIRDFNAALDAILHPEASIENGAIYDTG